MSSYVFSPIGIIHSCFKEKFGIPRQSGIVKNATSELHLNDEFQSESIRDLEGFSHLWITFVFHKNKSNVKKQMVRPPRLGGNKKVGVFASRSPFRPNALGLSAVELSNIELSKTGIVLHLDGADLLDGTPVLDIKPYLPYVDSIPEAKGGYAPACPESNLMIEFSQEASRERTAAELRLGKSLKKLIIEILQQDPRPQYQHQEQINSQRIYAMKLYDFDLKWQYWDNNKIVVLGLI